MREKVGLGGYTLKSRVFSDPFPGYAAGGSGEAYRAAGRVRFTVAVYCRVDCCNCDVLALVDYQGYLLLGDRLSKDRWLYRYRRKCGR
jgi:hypothetical protein